MFKVNNEDIRKTSVIEVILVSSVLSLNYLKSFPSFPVVEFEQIWLPPSPPEEGKIEQVQDLCLGFLYETATIPENHLPPTHYLRKNGMDFYAMKRNTSRTHYLSVFKKKRVRASKPKSIFDKKALELINKNKLKKSQKMKQKAMTVPVVPSAVTTRPDYSQQGPDWLVNEDWALLQAVVTLLELPLDFQNEQLSNKLVNWELAADIVNCNSRIRRSARQCRDRFQNVIIAREEGKLMVPLSEEAKLKKQKKNNGNIPPPNKSNVSTHPQPKTSSQFHHDQGKGAINMHFAKFESFKKAAGKRKPITKQPTSNKGQVASRHAHILAANGITSDKPLNPKELATMRAERIAKEKAQAVAQQQLQNQTSTSDSTSTSQTQPANSNRAQSSGSAAAVGQIAKVSSVGILQTAKGNLVFTSANAIAVGGSSLVVNPSGTSTSAVLNTTAASFAAINRKVQSATQNVISVGQVTPVTLTNSSRAGLGQGVNQINLVASRAANQIVTTVAVTGGSAQASLVAPTLVAQVQRGATITGAVGNASLKTQPFVTTKNLTQHDIAILRQQQQQMYQKQQQQQQRLQKQQQIKLYQQQQQLQQSQAQSQTTKQTSTAIVTTTNQIGSVTVQTMKAPVTLRGTTATQQNKAQLIEQAFKKQQLQQLQNRGQLASTSQIQQMLVNQLQQQQRQKLQQQQLKFQQQQVTASIVTPQPKAQLVMTQVKPGQGVTTQSIKTSAQAIQLQQIPQSGTIQATLPQQILLRPTTQSATGQPHFQGLPQQIQLRAMISQQSPQQIQQLHPMQAQVNLQTGTVVMQPQQVTSQTTSQQAAQIQVVSSLSQSQQRNIQAVVQKQQQQAKVTTVAASPTTSKSAQIQVQLQQASPQQLRQQVISATPAQLSQVKALVSQAQFEASISRSTSPTQATIQVTSEGTQSPNLQAQAQQVSQQIRHQALLHVHLKAPTSSSGSQDSNAQLLQQQQFKQQLKQLQIKQQAAKQHQLRQQAQNQQGEQKQQATAANPTTPVPQVSTSTEQQITKPDIVEVETLGAETELTSTDSHDDKDDVTTQLSTSGMRTRSHK